MINVTYGGKSFEVPPYVKYVAADKDKKVYGYSIKPKFDGSEGCWHIEYGMGCSVYLGELDAVENAPTYLTRVEAVRTPKKKPKGKVTVSNNDAVIEFLLSQLRQQLTNNPYKQQCEDLAHEVLSLKNQLRDASALVAELREELAGATSDTYELQEQSGCRKEDTQECRHNWRFVGGKSPAVCINCGATKHEECVHTHTVGLRKGFAPGFTKMCCDCGAKLK